MTANYVPGTGETDPKKIIMSLQNLAANLPPIVWVTKYVTASAAVTDVTSKTGGGTIVVPNGITPTLPASYPSIDFDYYGPTVPVNLYTETGPSETTATRLIRGQLPASATGTAQSVFAIENRPAGGGINGPAQGSYALNISSIKQSWTTTTQPGEIGGINVVVRNGGTTGGVVGDSSALLCNVQNIGASGFAVGIEGETSNIQSGTFTTLKAMHYHIGSIDAVTGDSQGLVVTAETGTLTQGLLIQSTGTAAWTTPILYQDNAGVAKFSVDTNGNITAAGGAWTAYTPTISSSIGTFTTVSATGRYKAIGKTTFVQIAVTITTNGTAAGSVIASLPSTAAATSLIAGRENASGGKMLQAVVAASSANLSIFNYDNTYPGGSGFLLILTGVYEAT